MPCREYDECVFTFRKKKKCLSLLLRDYSTVSDRHVIDILEYLLCFVIV